MCGIVGKFYFDTRFFTSRDLERMMTSIVHRGPDESGTFQDGRVALGFQRLSIIDTLSGQQPLYNETKRIVAIANGEIYNFRELRETLIGEGHTFRTRSDCEVVVHLYEEYGEKFIGRLNGMFAFCLYDLDRELLFMARDRMGIKPLYLYRNRAVLVFGSEIKGILAAGEVTRRREPDVLDEYLCFRSLANGRTFFSGVTALEPGTCLRADPGGVRQWKYWTPAARDREVYENEIVNQTRRQLHDSVDRQMVSDVPLGTLLSGGVDSSWVSAIAGTLHPGLKTFTVGFDEPAYDERSCAKLIARRSNLEYHEIVVGHQEFAQALPRAVWYHDEPLNHANSVQIYLISRYARQHVKVLLTGEGADELFGGYPRYYICKIGGVFFHLNPVFRKAVTLGLVLIPSRKSKKLLQFLGFDPARLVLYNSGFTEEGKVAYLLNKKNLDLRHRIEMLESSWDNGLPLMDNLLIFEQNAYLRSILMRQDKMSMAASIESRVPFLDNCMLALAHSIPAHLKVKRLCPKRLLKKAAERDIPGEIVYKKKVGFGVPIGKWLTLQDGLKPFLDLLLDCAGRIDGMDRGRCEQMVREHLKGVANHEDILWPLINYATWHNQYFG